MKTMKNALEEATKKLLVEPLLDMMTEQLEDFAEDQRKYREALSTLNDDMPVQELEKAIYRQIVSMVLFAGWLGFKANMDHFADPVARTFLEVDHETYLQEHVVQRLPQYKTAQNTIREFLSQLTVEQEETYETVMEYISHLETVVPKLAHYYGYLLGNEMLPNILPGYCEDVRLTLGYTAEKMTFSK